jgi:hypothetical protein
MRECIILRHYKFTWHAQGLLSIYLSGRQLPSNKIHYTNCYEILIFTFTTKKNSRPALVPTQPPIRRAVITPREKRPGHEACQLCPSSSKLKNVCRFNSRYVLCLHNLHRDKSTINVTCSVLTVTGDRKNYENYWRHFWGSREMQ